MEELKKGGRGGERMGGRRGERGGVRIVFGREGWEGIVYFHISIDKAVQKLKSAMLMSEGCLRSLEATQLALETLGTNKC